MMISNLNLPNSKLAQFEKKGIITTGELLEFFPRKYIDMRAGNCLKDVEEGFYVVIDGNVSKVDFTGQYPKVYLVDDNLDTLIITWFGTDYHAKQFVEDMRYRVYGKLSYKYGGYQMTNPQLYFKVGDKSKEIVYPVYSKIQGMSEDYLKKCITNALVLEEKHYIPTMKDLVAKQLGIVSRFKAIRGIHFPIDENDYKMSKKRIDYDCLYDFYENIKHSQIPIDLKPSISITSCVKTRSFIKSLPFALTLDQLAAVNYVIKTAIDKKERINTLITGDVGCGKTIVALLSSMLMWENGYQSIIMAPTLVLAKQHYEEMSSHFVGNDIPKFALLTSETKKRERSKILKGISDGSIDILIGTSSVLSNELEFRNLALTIVDEEHKFGSEQKELLAEKNKSGVHFISMTATPIPRSLAQTMYGEGFSIQRIATMPKGRKPVKTFQGTNKEDMYKKIAEQVLMGYQAYVICPFIKDSDSERFQDVDSVESVTTDLGIYLRKKYPMIKLDSIDGKMKQKSILDKISEFASHKFDILVSTTIVEVGVNVPNSTAILIMSAERFGLAALHQLRGRVGRNSIQSYCYLYTKEYSQKLNILCSTNSGFVIAEEDMRLRGPGNLIGEEQTGYSHIVETIIKRPKLAKVVRNIILKDCL